MLSTVRNLVEKPISAVDGPIGSVHSLLFDDATWAIRYVVVDCGKWLPGRRVLVSPMSVVSPDPHPRVADAIRVTVDRQKIKNSPDIDSDQPVSRQMSARVQEYYGYLPYWSDAANWGPDLYPGGSAWGPGGRLIKGPAHLKRRNEKEDAGDPYLRSTRAVKGYHLVATDGEIGHVDDFIVDDELWTIWRLIADISNWLGGRRVLVSPASVRTIDWNSSKLLVDITRERVRKSPQFVARDMLAHAPSCSSGNSNDVG